MQWPIKTHGSESWGQEEATCMHVFKSIWPLQWVIFMDASSKFKTLYLSCHSSYHLVYCNPSTSDWEESTALRWNRSTKPFLRISQVRDYVSCFATKANTQLLHVLWLNYCSMNLITVVWIPLCYCYGESISLLSFPSALPVSILLQVLKGNVFVFNILVDFRVLFFSFFIFLQTLA